MYLNTPTHDQPLRPECLSRKKSSPFPSFNYSEYIIGQVSSNAPDHEGGWRDTPPLNRFSADCRRDADESKAILSTRDEEALAENHSGVPLR